MLTVNSVSAHDPRCSGFAGEGEVTYCVDRTKLLAKAGRELAEKLLPQPFILWYSNHDTGCQMTIVAPPGGFQAMKVWKGSIWHSSRYEFNDSSDVPGLQSDFEFARPVIEKYFADVAAAVAERDAEHAEAEKQRQQHLAAEKQAALDAIREQVMP